MNHSLIDFIFTIPPQLSSCFVFIKTAQELQCFFIIGSILCRLIETYRIHHTTNTTFTSNALSAVGLHLIQFRITGSSPLSPCFVTVRIQCNPLLDHDLLQFLFRSTAECGCCSSRSRSIVTVIGGSHIMGNRSQSGSQIVVYRRTDTIFIK